MHPSGLKPVQDIDDYVHRIGRTGRAGKKGLATGFFCDADAPLARSLIEVLQVRESRRRGHSRSPGR